MFGLAPGIAWPAPAVTDTPPAPLPADAWRFCPTPDCDSSWWGPEPCWACGVEGVARAELPEGGRKTWGSGFTNGYSPNYELIEGNPL